MQQLKCNWALNKFAEWLYATYTYTILKGQHYQRYNISFIALRDILFIYKVVSIGMKIVLKFLRCESLYLDYYLFKSFVFFYIWE